MNKRPLCIMAVCAAAGIAMSRIPSVAGAFVVLLLCLPITAECWAVWRYTPAKEHGLRRKRKKRILVMALLVIASAGAGFCRTRQCELRQIPFQNEETAVLQGTVYDWQLKEEQTVLYLKDVTIQNDLEHSIYSEQLSFKGTCMAYYKGDDTFSVGNILTVRGIISLFEENSNPGQFHAKSYYEGLGIDFALFRTEVVENNRQEAWLRQGLHNVKTALHKRLEALAGSQAPILQAMLLGEKSGMDSEVKELYQRNGISHVLVISGLHFSLLGACVYQTLRKTGLPFAAAGAMSTALLFLYGMMTGFGVSAVRAFIMFAVSMGASALGRGYDLPSALGASVLYLLLRNPYVLFQTGFLLSVGAILGIIVSLPVLEYFFPLREPVKESDRKENRWKGRLHNWLLSVQKGMYASISIQIMTFPILLYSFYEFSPYSILLNCLVIPLVSVVVLCAVAAAVLSFLLPWLAQLVILPSIGVLYFYEGLCRLTARLPGASVVTGQPALAAVLLYYLLAAGIVLAAARCMREQEPDGSGQGKRKSDTLGNKKRRAVVSFIRKRCPIYFLNMQERMQKQGGRRGCTGRAACLLLCLGIVYVLFIYRDKKGVAISMLDVGQGQSIYIRDGSSDILYDGGSTDVSQVGRYRITPFLKAMGVDRLELVIVSHLDADHYNGIMQMLEEELIGIDCLMLPELEETDESYEALTRMAAKKGTTVKRVRSKDHFVMEHAEYDILHPQEGYQAADKNDTSIVMSLTCGNFRMLFTGDVEAAGEASMLSEELLEPVDVLQVAHHGSSSSSTREFLEKTAPRLALISCGEGNRYGHPSKETLQGLEEIGCPYYITMEEGCITFSIPENENE